MATFTITPIKTFVSGENVTPVKLNQLSQSTVALTAGSIVAADIASNAVTTVKLADSAVTTAKINNAAVTAAKLNGAQTGDAPIFGARAFVNFAGDTNSAGVANLTNTARFIQASGNVASVVRTAQGVYNITFTTPMQDANYSVAITANDPYGGSSGVLLANTAAIASVGALRVTPTAYVDMNNISVIVFR